MDALEFTFDEGSTASAGHFFRAGAQLVALLDEVSEVPVEWLVSDLRLGSAVAQISPPTDVPEASGALRSVTLGLSSVAAHHHAPPDWTPDAVATARHFVEAASTGHNVTASRLRLVTPDVDSETVAVTADLARLLATLQPFERRMPGAVRGHLVGLNVSRGNRASLRGAAGRVIRVSFGDELRQPLKQAMLEHVELEGEVRQGADGAVFHIRADGVRVLAAPDADWSSLFGLDPDLTGGRDIASYLQDARGEA